MNYQKNSYESNDDLDEPNPGSLPVKNTAARQKSSSYSSPYLDPFRGDKDCSPSSCSSSFHGPIKSEDDSEEVVVRVLEDGSNLRSSLKRSLQNNDDDRVLKKQKSFGTRIETEQPIKIEEAESEKPKQLTALQKSNTISVIKSTGKRALAKQVTDDAKKPKIDMTPPLKNLEHFRQFMKHKGNQRPTHRDLEEFTLLKMCETIYQHNQEILRQLRIKDLAFETLLAKYTNLQKQVTNLDIVQTRISNDMRKVQEPRDVVPVKITRSVGLQVNMHSVKAEGNLRHAPDPLEPITISDPLKKEPQRASATTNIVSILPPPPSVLTPMPAHIRPQLAPELKTISYKITTNSGQTRDELHSLLVHIPERSPTANNSAATATLRRPPRVYLKVIDLTNEDDSNRTSTIPATQLASDNIRVVTPHQLTNPSPDAVTPLVATNMPPLTYLTSPD